MDHVNARQPSTFPRAEGRPPRLTGLWLTLGLFVFVAFESALLAIAVQGPWLVLLAPAAVCTLRALDTWRDLGRAQRRPAAIQPHET